MRKEVEHWWLQSVPHELYDEEIAVERLEIAHKVVEWVRQELNR